MARTSRPRREIVRRRRRERQTLVFGVIFIALIAVCAIALAVYQGRIESPINEAFVTKSAAAESEVNLPCPPSGPDDSLPLESDKISVRVLNATDKQGLAKSTMEVLTGRGFVSATTGNYRGTFDGGVKIQFGADGLRQAYTLALTFPDVVMVYDNRNSAVVDLILGDKFEVRDMRPTYAPELDPTVELTAPGQCKPIDLVQPRPAPAIIPVDPLATASASPSPSATP